MALVVEDGTGLATAESYLSVADADTYLTLFSGASTEWTALSTAGKEVELRKASRYIDAEYGGNGGRGKSFIGSRYTLAQALDWPRSGAVTRDGFTIDTTGADSLPVKLKDAIALLASKSATADLIPDQTSPSTIKREKIELEGIEIDTTYENAADPEAFYRLAESTMRSLLRSSYDLRPA